MAIPDQRRAPTFKRRLSRCRVIVAHTMHWAFKNISPRWHLMASSPMVLASSCRVKASFHSGKLSVDWNGQENFSLCWSH
jgi:hypothetical protein